MKYWYAVRETWTNKTRTLKVLSRPMSKADALRYARFESNLVKRKNPNHKFKIIQMRD